MKVICIDSEYGLKVVVGAETSPDLPPIQEGAILNVIDETIFRGVRCYRFAEYVDVKYRWWYDASHFIPLSDKDETEMKREPKINLIQQ